MSIILATTTLLYYAKHNKCIQYSNAIILPLSHSGFGLLDIIMCYSFKCSEIIWRVRVAPDTKISIQYFYAYMRHNPGWHAICITSGSAVIASLVSYIMSHRKWMCIIIYWLGLTFNICAVTLNYINHIEFRYNALSISHAYFLQGTFERHHQGEILGVFHELYVWLRLYSSCCCVVYNVMSTYQESRVIIESLNLVPAIHTPGTPFTNMGQL